MVNGGKIGYRSKKLFSDGLIKIFNLLPEICKDFHIGFKEIDDGG